MVYTSAVVEGLLDEGVARRVLEDAGVSVSAVYGRQGKTWLLRQLDGYNAAARHSHWFVLLDLDEDADCAPDYLTEIQPQTLAEGLAIRLAVREIESWLLADRERIADFLHVSRQRVPFDPEALIDPKRELLHLASRSRLRAIREGMVSSENPDREGPLYTSELLKFVDDRADGWRPDVARERADSLHRCLNAIDSIS